MNLEEVIRADNFAGHFAVVTIGRNKCGNRDHPGLIEQTRYFGDAADVLLAFFGGEAEIAIQAVTDIVAIEDETKFAVGDELFFEFLGDGRFAGTAQPGQPDGHAALAEDFLPVGHGHGGLFAHDITIRERGGRRGSRHGAIEDHTGGHGGVGEAIDENEVAGLAVALVVIVGNWTMEGQQHPADIIHVKFGGIGFAHGVNIDPVAQFIDGSGNDVGGLLDQKGLSGRNRLFVHPDEHGFPLVADLGHVVGMHQHAAAAHVDFVLQRHRDCEWRKRLGQFAVVGDDRFNLRGAARRQAHHRVADADHA